MGRKEKEKNQFQASMDALKTVNLDSVDGTDVQARRSQEGRPRE